MRTSFSLHAPILTLLILTIGVIGDACAHEDITDTKTKDGSMNVMADVHPVKPHGGTSLASSLCPLIQSAGGQDWSLSRLMGVMGHAFQFEMKDGGGWIMHDHLDWEEALDFLPYIAQFQEFNAIQGKTDADLPTLWREARDAVRASLNRGVAAMAWSPLSPEMKAGPGPHPVCWGLIVGYNDIEETYTVRHPWVPDTYTVRYDAIGPGDHNSWFNVKVFEQHSTPDQRILHVTALRNGVAYAHGTRSDGDHHHADRPPNPQGFLAYEAWRTAFESSDVPLEPARHHADMIKQKRREAAGYVRELAPLFPEASEQFKAAATHYDRELESLKPLHDLCIAAFEKESITADERAEAQRLIGDALEADREAIAQIEAALKILDES